MKENLFPNDLQIFCQQAKIILSQISISEILRRKEVFRSIDLCRISDKMLLTEIKNVLEVRLDGKPYLINIFFSRIVGKKHISTNIYRIRRLTDEDISNNEFVSMKRKEDAWYPPKCLVTPGRLNKKGEALLYLADSPLTAIKETHLETNELFYLIIYKTKSPFRIAYLDQWQDVNGLNEEENFKLQLLNDFLISEFTKDVGKGTEYLYRPSEIIAKNFLQHEEKDLGWMYPSISNKRGFNLCFKSNIATRYLDLVGVRVCKLKDKINYNIAIVGDGIINDKGQFLYMSPSSKLSRQTFIGCNAAFGFN